MSVTDTSVWMRSIPGSYLITQLSIPGTHQSYLRNNVITVGWPFDRFATCQYNEYDVPRQLRAGVRFFDFRMQNAGEITHGRARTKGIFFSEVRVCLEFLQENPSECVLVSSKWEKEDTLTGNKTPEDPNEVKWVVGELKYRFGADKFWFERKTPRLDQVRGKIIFLSRWAYETDAKEGIRFDPSQESGSDPAYRAQDRFDLTKLLGKDIPRIKWEDHVLPFLSLAIKSAESEKGTWFYNFLSGYAGAPPSFNRVEPHDLAWGWADHEFGVNNYLEKHLKNGTGARRLGIVIIDFVNDDLARLISGTNFPIKSGDSEDT